MKASIRRLRRLLAPSLVLIASLAAHYLVYAARHGHTAPTRDLIYSISCAQNYLASGVFGTFFGFSDSLDDLRPRYLTQWPPGMGLIYLGILSAGFELVTAHALIALASAAVGGAGWLLLLRAAGLEKRAILFIAALLPWLPWVSGNFRTLLTDFVLWAVMPWICYACLRLVSHGRTAGARTAGMSICVGLALGATFLIKYSALPLIAATLLTVSRELVRRGASRATIAAFVASGGALPILAACAYFFFRGPGPESFPLGSSPDCRRTTSDELLALLFRPFLVFVAPWFPSAWQNGQGALLAAIAAAACLLWIAWHNRGPSMPNSYRILCSMFLLQWCVTAGLFVSIAFFSSYCFDWGTKSGLIEARYFAPPIFGLIFVAALPVYGTSRKGIRSLLSGILLGSQALAVLTSPNTAPARTYLDNSGVAWDTSSDSAALWLQEFASRTSKPDLVISNSPILMIELGVPVYMMKYVKQGMVLRSSRPRTVWLMTERREPNKQRKFLEAMPLLQNATEIEFVPVPEEFHRNLWILRIE